VDATLPLNPALAGFSIETISFEGFTGNQSYPNTFSLNLFENLKERTGVPAEVRIGGITADSTFWDPNQEAGLYNFIDSTGAQRDTKLGPQFWNSVKLLPDGTKIVMTLVGHLLIRSLDVGVKLIRVGSKELELYRSS
jgi:hypothetical protein